MSKKATKAGYGNLATLKPSAVNEGIPKKKCVGPDCDTVTSIPYSKLRNGDYLCSGECDRNHYAKQREMWVSRGMFVPASTLRVVS